MAGATVKVDVLGMILGRRRNKAETAEVGCGKGSDGREEEKRREPKWGVIEAECEAVARVVEKCGRWARD
jgi:hypothetical protein